MAHMERIERDSLGERAVPAEACYGIQTQRAIDNFPISGLRAHPALVDATLHIKRAAAIANRDLGRLDPVIADAIVSAVDLVLAGSHRDQFVVDVYQAGAGTSHHMNVNEVLANVAADRLGAPRGEYTRVHPNDHVNMGQSTNDVFPSATRIALIREGERLIAAARLLSAALAAKASAFALVVKTGRTHLQDAVPITLGQEFEGYAACIAHAAEGIARACDGLRAINLGATAVGTGLNAGPEFVAAALAALNDATGLDLQTPDSYFRVTQSMGDCVAYSGAVRLLAIEAGKIASDLRLLSMGPRAGLAEIVLPAVQPGSSIMPGKVNPSVPEMVNQVVYQVIGCDTTVVTAAEAGQLELNVMMPVIAWNALHATGILANALAVLRERTVEGLTADETRCRELLDRSTATATALSPHIGYAATAKLAQEAVATGRPLAALAVERGLISAEEAARVLSPEAMTQPGVRSLGAGAGGGRR